MGKINAMCNYDFTLWDKLEKLDVITIRDLLRDISKKYCFQLEDAGSGLHYQGRFSLKVKKRINEVKFLSAHLSPTSVANCENDFYVCKEETRIAGPWRNTDVYVPRQVREVCSLYEWQKKIEDNIGVWNTRVINVVFDPKGCTGKSTLVAYLCCKHPNVVRVLPALPAFKDLMGAVMCMPTASLYLVDMPRGLDKSRQGEFYAALESIKDGHVFDTRYSYKEKWFDCPNIWVFTNVLPERELLSMDRWKHWKVASNDLRALTL